MIKPTPLSIFQKRQQARKTIKKMHLKNMSRTLRKKGQDRRMERDTHRAKIKMMMSKKV